MPIKFNPFTGKFDITGTSGGGGSSSWGSITGTLSNQTDLQTALNAKATDSLVAHLAGSETISGTKTFGAAPRFASSIGINDANGVNLIAFPATVASAANYLTISNSATSPSISATGSSTNINIILAPKGTGQFITQTNTAASGNMVSFQDFASAAGERFVTIYPGSSPSTSNKVALQFSMNNASSAASVKSYVWGKTEATTASAEDSSFGIDITEAGARTNVVTYTKTAGTFQKNVIFKKSIISDSKQVHTAGASVTISAGIRVLVVNPASTLAALTITMPASPTDGEEVLISFGGTVTTGNVVTSLTIQGNTSQTVLWGDEPPIGTAGSGYMLKWESSTSLWRAF